MKELEQWKMFMLTENKSEKTIVNYVSDVQILIDWIKSRYGLDEVDVDILKLLTLSDFHSFIYYLMTERKNNEASRARRINAIKSFFKYLCKIGILNKNENITVDLEIPKLSRKLPKFLSEEEVKQLITVASNGYNAIRNKAILMLFLNTGIRKSELINLNINDIQDDKVRVVGKGNKERIICINQDTIDAINAWLTIRPAIDGKDKDALFLSEHKNRISANAVGRLVKNILRKINKGNYSTHVLRHSTATLMLKNGQDFRTVQEILGHVNSNTTAIYTHVLEEQKRSAANSISFT